MKLPSHNARNIAIFALISSAFLGAVMGVWVRLMSAQLENFQQISARAIIGSIIGIALYTLTKQIKISKFKQISKSDLLYIIGRALSLIIGIGLFTFAINNANFSNINMIYAVPSTAILGIILLKEKLTLVKFFALLFGFFGVVLISMRNFSNLSAIGLGEVAAFISTFFYSLSYIARKFISKAMNNEEIAIAGSFVMGLLALFVSIVVGNPLRNFFILDWNILLVVFSAGLTFILIGVTNNYGFEHLEAIVGNNLLTLSPLFGLAIGVILYKETPTLFGLIGGIMVIVSAAIINYADVKKIKMAEPSTVENT